MIFGISTDPNWSMYSRLSMLQERKKEVAYEGVPGERPRHTQNKVQIYVIYLRTALISLWWWHTSLKICEVFFPLDLSTLYWKSTAWFISLSSFLLQNHRFCHMWLCGKLYPGRTDWATSASHPLRPTGRKHSKSLCQIASDFLFWPMVRWFIFEIEHLEHFLLRVQFAEC